MSCRYLYVSIMSPLMRLYTSDGSLSFRNRSGYVSVFKLLMSGTVFVALLCTRSIASISLISLGLHIALPYSNIGCTLDVKSCRNISLSLSECTRNYGFHPLNKHF